MSTPSRPRAPARRPTRRRMLEPDVVEQELPASAGATSCTTPRAATSSSSSTTPAGATSTSSTRAGATAASVTLTDAQARTLGAILGGAYFKPAVVEEMEAVIGGLLIDWVTLPDGAPAASAGRSPSWRSAAGPA